MKPKTSMVKGGLKLLLGLLFIGLRREAFGQTTSFIYQGHLISGGSTASGYYDFQFLVFDTPNLQNQIGPTLTFSSVPVTNGTFTVSLDFGAIFNRPQRWLELHVRTNGAGAFTVISPRQPFTSVPYAQAAGTTTNITGTLSVSSLPTAVALLTGNQVFSGTVMAGVLNGTLSSNSIVPDSALSSNVNLSIGANQQIGISVFPPILNATYARLPWLGYNSDFDEDSSCGPSAAAISNIITLWATNGMRDAGYTMIQLDDGWQPATRSGTNAMPYNTNSFPNGIAPLVQYAHEQGFQFQLYFSEGPSSCCGFASTTGHEAADCAEAAAWGVDWLKIDFCGTYSTEAAQVLWQSLIYQSGRPISLMMSINDLPNILSYGNQMNDWEFGTQTSVLNSPGFFLSLLYMINLGTDTVNGKTGWPQQLGPGHFNDAGILWVNPHISLHVNTNQARQSLSGFAILASPFATDGTPDAANLTYLTNTEVIGILKDPLCLRGQIIYASNRLEAFYKPLQNGGAAIAILNNNDSSSNLTINWNQIGIPFGTTGLVRDPWLHQDLGFFTNSFTAKIAAQDIYLFEVFPQTGTVSGSTVSGNLSAANFNGGTNASANSVLAGNGQWISMAAFADPAVITNFDLRNILVNGPITFNSTVTLASPSTVSNAIPTPNTLVASYSVTNVSTFNSGPLFTPSSTGLYKVMVTASVTQPSTAAGGLQIYLAFANPAGTTVLNTISTLDLTQSSNATVTFTGAYEMTSYEPVAINSNLTGNPTNQLYNVRCSIVQLQ